MTTTDGFWFSFTWTLMWTGFTFFCLPRGLYTFFLLLKKKISCSLFFNFFLILYHKFIITYIIGEKNCHQKRRGQMTHTKRLASFIHAASSLVSSQDYLRSWHRRTQEKKNIITSLPLIRCVLLLQHFFSRYILLALFPHFFFHVIVHKLTKDIHPEFWRRQTGGVIPRIERRCYIGWVVIVIDGQLQDVKVLRSRARRKKKNLRIFSYYAILV